LSLVGGGRGDGGGGLLETLKWLIFRKWDKNWIKEKKDTALFTCPHCGKRTAKFSYNAEQGKCQNRKCPGKELLLTDWLGFHQIMARDSAPDQVPNGYMIIHETLLLFSIIRYFWENDRERLHDCLFIKDGPLYLMREHKKLIPPKRSFLQYAYDNGYNINLVRQEKSGRFYEHLQMIGPDAPPTNDDNDVQTHVFIPSEVYIEEEIQQRPKNILWMYGEAHNYGAKLFVKYNKYESMVLNIPTGEYKLNPNYSDLIGADDILTTLQSILDYRHQGALMPIEFTHDKSSISDHAARHILQTYTQNLCRGGASGQ
jgi:hypothetical protein